MSSLTRSFSLVNAGKKGYFPCTYLRHALFSTVAPEDSSSSEESIGDGLGGDLFHAAVGQGLMGKSAWIRRTFDARSNSLALLTCGGPALAKHASFDPEYHRGMFDECWM